MVECGGMKLGCHVVVNRINDPMRKWDVNFEDFGFGDYRLSDEEFNDLVSFCGEVSVDYFVSDYSFGMRPFFLRYISGLSAGCVVFAQGWSRGFGFFCSPVGLVSRLMDEVREDGAKGVLVVADWSQSMMMDAGLGVLGVVQDIYFSRAFGL